MIIYSLTKILQYNCWFKLKLEGNVLVQIKRLKYRKIVLFFSFNLYLCFYIFYCFFTLEQVIY